MVRFLLIFVSFFLIVINLKGQEFEINTKPKTFKKLNISGEELITIIDIEKGIKPRAEVKCEIKYKDGTIKTIELLSRIDTVNEIEYYKNGGILQYVLRNMIN